MQDFIANSSRRRIALLILASAAFVVGGLWMVGAFGTPQVPPHFPLLLVYGVGWASILFFGLCGVSWVRKLFKVGEEIRIGSAGIRWARWSDATIPWSEISDVTVWSYRGQRLLVLHLHNPALFPGQGALALAAKTNRALTGGDIALSLVATDRTFDEAMAAIERFRG